MVIIEASCDGNKKTKKIGARVTENQKKLILKRAEKAGMKESEYILYCCLKNEEMPTYYILKGGNTTRIEVRVTEEEKKEILKKAENAKIKDLSKYVRNCCLGKDIIVINDLKTFSKELHKIGNNLNQLTMLCHQGLIEVPDINETREILQKIYKELVALNMRKKLGR